MKLPNQAQPITRGISTSKIIGDKGIGQSKGLSPCIGCLGECRGVRGQMRLLACLTACTPACVAEGFRDFDIIPLFKSLG